MSHIVKPARWAWNRGLLVPEYADIANGLTHLWHVEASAGTLGVGTDEPEPKWRDVITWDTMAYTAGLGTNFLGMISGVGVVFDYDNDDYHSTGFAPNWGTDDWSAVVYWAPRRETPQSTACWVWGSIAEKGTHDPVLAIWNVWNTGSDSYRPGYYLRDGSGNVPGLSGEQYFGPTLATQPSTTNPGADDFWCAVFSKRGSEITVTLNGVVLRTHTGLSGNFDFSSYPFYVGLVNNRGTSLGTNASLSPFGLVGFWDRAITNAEAVLVTRNPWGLIRPAVIAGSLPTSAPAGSTTLAGSLFTSTATWHSGHTADARFTVSVSQLGDGAEIGYVATPAGSTTLVGSLFTSTANFYAGTADLSETLAGSLFTSTANFYSGTAALSETLVGTTYDSITNFYAGNVAYDETLVGSLFTSTANFLLGSLDIGAATTTLTGTLFTSTANFYAGTADLEETLVGSLFTSTANFYAGTADLSETLVGTTYDSITTWYTGTVDSDNYLTAGAAFVSTANFYAGTADLSETLVGTLFTSTANFYAGDILYDVTLTGSLFTSTANFYAGVAQGEGVDILVPPISGRQHTPQPGVSAITPPSYTYSQVETAGEALSVTGTEPSGTSQGDLLVAILASDGNESHPLNTGWTRLLGPTGVSLGVTQSVQYLIRGVSAPDLTFEFGSEEEGRVTIIRVPKDEYDSSDPFATAANDSGTSLEIDFNTLVGGTEYLVVVAGVSDSEDAVTFDSARSTPSTGWTVLVDDAAGDLGGKCYTYQAIQVTSTASPDFGLDIASSQQWVSSIFAIKPRVGVDATIGVPSISGSGSVPQDELRGGPESKVIAAPRMSGQGQTVAPSNAGELADPDATVTVPRPISARMRERMHTLEEWLYLGLTHKAHGSGVMLAPVVDTGDPVEVFVKPTSGRGTLLRIATLSPGTAPSGVTTVTVIDSTRQVEVVSNGTRDVSTVTTGANDVEVLSRVSNAAELLT